MSTVGTIVVKPEELVTKSAELRKEVVDLKNQFEIMNSLVEKTKNYWLGEAGNFHRDMYNQSVQEEPALIKSLEEYSDALNKIAANYEGNEKKLVEKAGALSGDILT